jgi:hypothetical protein
MLYYTVFIPGIMQCFSARSDSDAAVGGREVPIVGLLLRPLLVACYMALQFPVEK